MNLIEGVLFISLVVSVCFATLQELDSRYMCKPTERDPARKRFKNLVLVFVAACAACFVCQFGIDHCSEVVGILCNITPALQRARVEVFTDPPAF